MTSQLVKQFFNTFSNVVAVSLTPPVSIIPPILQTLLAILRSKEGDDNWVTGKTSEETKDSLRKKVKDAEAVIADLEHTITMVKQDMIDNR